MEGPKPLDVLYPIIEEIAKGLENHESRFKQDPELYTTALLLEVKRRLQMRSGTIYSALELACRDKNIDEARELLGREKVAQR
jgi:hypothetical protein